MTQERETLRQRLGHIVFETHEGLPQRFDTVLLFAIILSVIAIMLESVASIRARFGLELVIVEWAFTALFTVEYVLRIWVARKPIRYVRSFFGIVDLLSILPSYLALFFVGLQSLMVIRILRVLRVFRILKIVRMSSAASSLAAAMRASMPKIIVFIGAVLLVVVVIGSVMYIIEGVDNGFTSIPRSVYWAVVTLTTVGYGDIAPQTPHGQALAAFVMILGYGIIAVPTGIISAELVSIRKVRRTCVACEATDHNADATFCRRCGAVLELEAVAK